MNKTLGIDMTSGSLGNGMSIGVGMALAGEYTGEQFNVFVIMGDGELEEGIVWEGMMSATKYKLGRLIVFVDHNGWQSGDYVNNVSGLLPIYEKFEAFGWHCQRIDGHNLEAIINAVEAAKRDTRRPSLILADTIKGKGIPFMENDNSWHKRVPSKEQYEDAMKILGNN
jgi:transketolase